MIIKRHLKQFNYGLAILKTILAFYVIRYHCYKMNTKTNIIIYYIIIKRRNIHVPSFFNMSFYFNNKCLISRDSKRIFRRFERLLIPYIFWPIIIYIINIIFVNKSSLKIHYPFKKLLLQLILGRGIINPLWFQFDLIFVTFLFLFVIYIFKKHYLVILQILMILNI